MINCFFEMLLLEIRTSTNYVKRKKRDDSQIIQKLEEDIKILDNTVDGDDELECKKKKLETNRKKHNGRSKNKIKSTMD